MYNKNIYKEISSAKKKEIENFAKDYEDFLSVAKTERLAVEEIERLAKNAGFKKFDAKSSVKAGDKLYFINKGKNAILYVVGQNPITHRYTP